MCKHTTDLKVSFYFYTSYKDVYLINILQCWVRTKLYLQVMEVKCTYTNADIQFGSYMFESRTQLSHVQDAMVSLDRYLVSTWTGRQPPRRVATNHWWSLHKHHCVVLLYRFSPYNYVAFSSVSACKLYTCECMGGIGGKLWDELLSNMEVQCSRAREPTL